MKTPRSSLCAPVLVIVLGAPACDRPAHDHPMPAPSTTTASERASAHPAPWEPIDPAFTGCDGA